MMNKTDFKLSCIGAVPGMHFEDGFFGSLNAYFGVRNVATYFPDHQARLYRCDDQYDYETYDDAKEFEDALRWFIDHTPEEYFNDEDYVLDTTDIINAHD